MSDAYRDLVHLAEASVARFADRPLFGERRDGTWQWTTYAALWRRVTDLRGGLASLGIGPGQRVAIVSRNSATWAAVAYATYSLGAELVPMYEAQRPDDWEFVLADSEATVVLGRGPRVVGALDAMRPRLPALRHVIDLDGASDSDRSLARLIEIGRAHPVAAVYPDPDDVAGLIYTSGTTGRPKGAMLTHANLASNIAATIAVFPITPDDRTVSFLPWAHVYGQVCELHILMASGASTAFNDDIDRLVDDLREVRPTMLVAVPRIFNRIHTGVRTQIDARSRAVRWLFHRGLDASRRRRRGERLGGGARVVWWLADRLVFAKIRRRFGGRLRYAISASATLSREVAEFVDALGIDVYEGYGLTETSPVVATNAPAARRLGSVGRAIPGVTIEIDESSGTIPGEGEIVVHGPNVMKGYHARPDDNAKTFTADRGLRTGDLGRIDDDGYLFITGRIKDQFKLENGKYVMPGVVEQRLAQSPFIANVFVHGAARPYTVAVVVPDVERARAWAEQRGIALDPGPTTDPTIRWLIGSEIARLSDDLRPFEQPRAFVVVTEDFTVDNGLMTPTLKLKRREIEARHTAAIDAMYVSASAA